MEKVRVMEEDFSIQKVVDSVRDPRSGGIVTFLGTVRGEDIRGRIDAMEVESYREMALEQLWDLRSRALDEYDLVDMAIVHRVGRLSPGENIVMIAAAGVHRENAFAAARFVIDEIKRLVPIWKKELFSDQEHWVEEEK
ncbi:MAG: molybdenum cofactor biosynthesis protein MoaE [Methanomassiliicoccales archaeon]